MPGVYPDAKAFSRDPGANTAQVASGTSTDRLQRLAAERFRRAWRQRWPFTRNAAPLAAAVGRGDLAGWRVAVSGLEAVARGPGDPRPLPDGWPVFERERLAELVNS